MVSGVICSIANSADQLGHLLGAANEAPAAKPVVQLSFQSGEKVTIKSHQLSDAQDKDSKQLYLAIS